jgi:hypothetical protein
MCLPTDTPDLIPCARVYRESLVTLLPLAWRSGEIGYRPTSGSGHFVTPAKKREALGQSLMILWRTSLVDKFLPLQRAAEK